MSERDNIKKLRWSQVIAITICLFTTIGAGCHVEDNWTDKMLSEMESAWGKADQSKLGQEGNYATVTKVVQNYFRPGMNKSEALTLLRQLKEDGFDISEWRHDGARDWPNGELKPYLDEATRRNLQQQYPKGVSEFVAEKQYGRYLLIITKHAVIRFRVADGKEAITEVEGDIWASGI